MIPALIGAGASIIGGLLGSKKGATDQTTSNTKSMDPTVRKWYFGEDGNGGLLGDLNKWYSENKSGLNPDMIAGLDHMRSVYQSPLATQGYERMGNAGFDLMGRGVASNPFVTGQMPNFGNLQQPGYQLPQAPQQPTQPTQNLGLSQPLSLSDGWANPPAPVAPAPAAPAAPAAPTMDQDTFRKLYDEEMKRQQKQWYETPSNNPTAGFGA